MNIFYQIKQIKENLVLQKMNHTLKITTAQIRHKKQIF